MNDLSSKRPLGTGSDDLTGRGGDRPPHAGLYIHIPFCRQKCPYCGFFSVPSPSLIRPWIKTLLKEILLYGEGFGPFDSLYLGGGTPSLLSIPELTRIMTHLRAHFQFRPDTEITLEANPCDVSPEKLWGLRELGVNRISLGVQSFDARALAFLGRRHTVRDAENAVRHVKEAGFDNISLDLIYGFHAQPLQSWKETLHQAVSFAPAHLSCYELTIENRTYFGKLVQTGGLSPLSPDEARTCFLTTSRLLEAYGYTHYEISSFARPENRYARHNWKYWRHAPYLGLGPSAHSFVNSRRWWNVQSVRTYMALLNRDERPVEGFEDLTDTQLRLEAVALGLRTREGVATDRIGPSMEVQSRLSHLTDAGFLELCNGRARPTRKGFLVADYLPAYLC
ncbi:MAG: radical SAM family heme chaperone HemW [Desulfobacteraceae bacterium]